MNQINFNNLAQNRYKGVIDTGREGLALFGVSLPEGPGLDLDLYKVSFVGKKSIIICIISIVNIYVIFYYL
jgi:hypothetical protein